LTSELKEKNRAGAGRQEETRDSPARKTVLMQKRRGKAERNEVGQLRRKKTRNNLRRRAKGAPREERDEERHPMLARGDGQDRLIIKSQEKTHVVSKPKTDGKNVKNIPTTLAREVISWGDSTRRAKERKKVSQRGHTTGSKQN